MKEKNVKGSQKENSGYPQRKAHQTNSRYHCRNPISQKRLGVIFNILKEKNFQPRISYPAKLNFISKGEIRSFSEKQMLREFITTCLTRAPEGSTVERKNHHQPLQKRTYVYTPGPL